MQQHVILLGDSIFDNGLYVPGGPSVTEHVRRLLPREYQVTRLALDGATVSSVFRQLERIPSDATQLVLSAGGNDALWMAGNIFAEAASDIRESLARLGSVMQEFSAEYHRLICELREFGLPLTVCTIYDAVPGLDAAETAGLCIFNDVITRTAFMFGLTLVDLRSICREAADYAEISPIEPSACGGGKIARAIVESVLGGSGYSRVIARS